MEESTTAGAIADAEQLEARVAKLDSIIFRCRDQRREASIEAGWAFIELKKLLNHGEWQRHVKETFGAHAITLRTAERWMKRARKKEAESKNDSVSIFKLASDEGALEIREATDEAQAEVEAASNDPRSKKDSRHIYRLPLRMTADEIDSAETLQKLPDWHRAERKIVRLMGELYIKYGVVSNDDRRQS